MSTRPTNSASNVVHSGVMKAKAFNMTCVSLLNRLSLHVYPLSTDGSTGALK